MTVVVGVDNSVASRAALRIAAQVARWRQDPLVAVTAYDPPPGAPVGGYPQATSRTDSEDRATAESALHDTVSHELGGQSEQADLKVSAGLAGRVIIEAAREAHAQLIVLAARAGKPIVPG
jgi:nucleotide-binding universal stress UspA family protein